MGRPLPAARSWHLHRAEQHRFADAPLLFRNELTAVNGIHCGPNNLECGAPPPTLRSQNSALLPTHPLQEILATKEPNACRWLGIPMTLTETLVRGRRRPPVSPDRSHPPQTRPKRQPTFSVMSPLPWCSCPLLILQNRTMNPCLCAASERRHPDLTASRANPMAHMVPLPQPNRTLLLRQTGSFTGEPSLVPLGRNPDGCGQQS